MIENIANNYANYVKLDVQKDLQPIHDTIDELQTRLEEFESLMKMVEHEGQNVSTNTFSRISEFTGEITVLTQRIDSLQLLVNKVHDDLALVEKQVEVAEVQIGVPDNKLKNLFKPFLSKLSKEFPLNTNTSDTKPESFNYIAPKTFKTSDYFNANETDS